MNTIDDCERQQSTQLNHVQDPENQVIIFPMDFLSFVTDHPHNIQKWNASVEGEELPIGTLSTGGENNIPRGLSRELRTCSFQVLYREILHQRITGENRWDRIAIEILEIQERLANMDSKREEM